jgi:rifampicin phosphotransferase
VGEALPGVATPLTWSVLSTFSELGFRKAFGALGCSVPKGASFVGNFRGRIYLNLTELAEVASQVPGLRPGAVLPLGGGAEIERLERDLPRGASLRFLSRLPLTAARFVHENLGLGRRVERFEPGFHEEAARIRALDLRILPSPSLDETLSDVHRLLNETGGLMLTAYGSLLAALVPLSAALRLFAGDDAQKLQRDLLSSLRDVESADPGRELARIAALAAFDEPARRVIETRASALRVEDLPLGPTRTAVHAFLVRHGHRGVREAELAEPRWREDPTLLFDIIRLHLREPEHTDPARNAEAVRARSEVALLALSLPARGAVTGLLSVVRRSMRLRERLRGHVTQVLDLLRLLCCDVSRRLSIREPGIGTGAAFFLTLPELHAFLRGELRAVRPLVQMRRAGYERDRLLPDPPDTFVDYPPPATQLSQRRAQLEGLAASSGQVRGRARVLTSAAQIPELQRGEILVVPAADIGWSPVFLVAAGLATDLGGPLSHACVVAREYGVPAVVNLRNATRVVRTGDYVLLDGDAGRLQVLSDADA